MKLILKEDVAGLGYKDDVVEVKNGYGRNYPIPTGRGVIATPSALKVLAENLRQRAHKLAQLKADAEALAEATGHEVADFREAIRPKNAPADAAFTPHPYYQVYARRHGFQPNMSVADLLFNEGPEGIFYL